MRYANSCHVSRVTRRALPPLAGFGLALALAACSSGGSSSSSSGTGSTANTSSSGTYTVTISAGIAPGASAFNNDVLAAISTGIETATHDKVKVKLYPSNELYSDQTLALSAAGSGQVDAVLADGADASSLIKAEDASSLPFVASTVAQYIKVFSPGSPLFAQEQKEAATHNLTLLSLPATTPGEVGFAFKASGAQTLSSVSGAKVRIAGPGIPNEIVSALDGSAVQLSTTEEASGLSAGTVSVLSQVSPSVTSTALKGIVHAYLDPGAMLVADYSLFFNTGVWSKLPATIQSEITSSITAALDKYNSSITANSTTALNLLRTQGVTVSTASSADQQKYTTLLHQKIWPSFKAEDPAAYSALESELTALGLPS
jgi:TRAP-type C4-dicarboxylate transport system substrate-binding protein